MKNILLTLFALLLFASAKGQGFEWSVQANSGLYRYTGNGSTSSTIFNGDPSSQEKGYANNPYGSTLGFSYGGSFEGTWIAKSGFIAGLNGSLDVLQSRENITTATPNVLFSLNISPPLSISMSGYSGLTTEDINANPFIGYRFKGQKIKIDIMAGADLAFSVNTYEHTSLKDANGDKYANNSFLNNLPADTRIRIGTAIWYHRLGITASYAAGLTNLTAKELNDSTPPTTKSELGRFGLAYRLK